LAPWANRDRLHQRHFPLQRIDTRLLDLSVHRHLLRHGSLDQDRHLRIDEEAFLQAAGDLGRDLLTGMSGDLDPPDQRK